MKNAVQKILIVDDDIDLCFLLNHFLSRKGFLITERYTGASAMKFLETEDTDLVICDLKLDDTDGITLLNSIKALHQQLPVIIITGFTDAATNESALRQGAFKYISKPLLPEDILIIIEQALAEKARLEPLLKENKKTKPGTDQPYFNTKALRYIINQVNLVSPSAYNVIIYGEKGTGKKTIAYEIHNRSKRAAMPFLPVDSVSLFENFEKNIELVNGGTLFINKIEKLSQENQTTLLGIIKDKKIKNKKGIKDIDIRVLCATSNSLWDEVSGAGFKEALYQCLNGFNITVPPLRERREDILSFATHFLRISNARLNKNLKGFSPEVEFFFLNYAWYNNLSELKSMIDVASLLTTNGIIDLNTLPLNTYTNLLPPAVTKEISVTPEQTTVSFSAALNNGF